MECQPSYATPRSSSPSRGAFVAAVAELMGTPFQPWQRHIAEVANEFDSSTGLPVYRKVVVTVPRQSGKTVWLFAQALDRALVWPAGLEEFAAQRGEWAQRQLIMMTAQTATAATNKLIRDVYEGLIVGSALEAEVASVFRAQNSPALRFRNGASIEVTANTRVATHGRTVHMALRDELFADQDWTRDQALVPAMATLDTAQDLATSTMGDDESVVLNAEVDAGRASVLAGECSQRGAAYFEWSVPADADVADPRVWARHMPGLEGGVTSLRAVRHAWQTLPEREFRRAFGNQRQSGDDVPRFLPEVVWARVRTSPLELQGDVCVAVEAAPDLSSLVAVGCDERGVTVLLRTADVADLLPVVADLLEDERNMVVVDERGPLAPWVDDVRDVARAARAQRQLVFATSQDIVCWSMEWFVALADVQPRVVAWQELDAAASVARSRTITDRWVFDRREGGHLLMACAVAWGARRRRVAPRVPELVWVA